MSNDVFYQSGRKNKRVGVLLSALILGLALLALRYGVIEKGLLPRDCGPTGSDSAFSCGLTWLLVRSFRVLGWLALVSGGLGFLFVTLRSLGWVGWLTGVAGLVLYCPDTAAVGALLGLFTLLRDQAGRAPMPDLLNESGRCQHEPRQ